MWAAVSSVPKTGKGVSLFTALSLLGERYPRARESGEETAESIVSQAYVFKLREVFTDLAALAIGGSAGD